MQNSGDHWEASNSAMAACWRITVESADILAEVGEWLSLCTVSTAVQSFGERLVNTVFYYGSLAGEHLRALPLYTSLGTQYGVDCLSTPVSARSID